MNLDELTLGQIKQIQSMCGSEKTSHPYKIGTSYLIRTITMIYTGKLVEVYKDELVLEQCAWIAETDRWSDTCRDGKLKEVEPYVQTDQVIIGRGAILDVSVWHKPLPSEQK